MSGQDTNPPASETPTGGQSFGPSKSDHLAFQELVERLVRDGVIRGGPFEGVRLGAEASWGGIAPYLVGSYESELHDVIESHITKGYAQVIDIGCAEGYYAVGLAVRMPDAEVIAFDIDPRAQALCEAMADDNGVADRVHVHGACTAQDLAMLIQPGSLIIVDCEGAELDILEPEMVPGLSDADLIVEMHDFVDPTISTELLRRFSPTHHIAVVDAVPAEPQRYPVLRDLPPWVQFLASYEGRPTEPHPMQWAVMERRSHGNA